MKRPWYIIFLFLIIIFYFIQQIFYYNSKDAGGLVKEMFSLFFESVVDKKYKLFEKEDTDYFLPTSFVESNAKKYESIGIYIY